MERNSDQSLCCRQPLLDETLSVGIEVSSPVDCEKSQRGTPTMRMVAVSLLCMTRNPRPCTDVNQQMDSFSYFS